MSCMPFVPTVGSLKIEIADPIESLIQHVTSNTYDVCMTHLAGEPAKTQVVVVVHTFVIGWVLMCLKSPTYHNGYPFDAAREYQVLIVDRYDADSLSKYLGKALQELYWAPVTNAVSEEDVPGNCYCGTHHQWYQLPGDCPECEELAIEHYLLSPLPPALPNLDAFWDTYWDAQFGNAFWNQQSS